MGHDIELELHAFDPAQVVDPLGNGPRLVFEPPDEREAITTLCAPLSFR